jgi:hypothetical protein
MAAYKAGCRKLLLGVGGSATNDGKDYKPFKFVMSSRLYSICTLLIAETDTISWVGCIASFRVEDKTAKRWEDI